MTLNGVGLALIMRYFTEFGRFGAHCVNMVEDVVVKQVAQLSQRERATP